MIRLTTIEMFIITLITVFLADLFYILLNGGMIHFGFVLLTTIIIVMILKIKHKKTKRIVVAISLLFACVGMVYKWNQYQKELLQYPSDDIYQTTSLKLEYVNEANDKFIYIPDDGEAYWEGLRNSLSKLSYIPANAPFEGDWIYRMICNVGHGEFEIEVLVGEKSTSVNGINYVFDETEEISSQNHQKRFVEEVLTYWYHDNHINQFKVTPKEFEEKYIQYQ